MTTGKSESAKRFVKTQKRLTVRERILCGRAKESD